ncbi:MAG: hypothetical protein AB8B96_06595 [Lysobacterales bacterium]
MDKAARSDVFVPSSRLCWGLGIQFCLGLLFFILLLVVRSASQEVEPLGPEDQELLFRYFSAAIVITLWNLVMPVIVWVRVRAYWVSVGGAMAMTALLILDSPGYSLLFAFAAALQILGRPQRDKVGTIVVQRSSPTTDMSFIIRLPAPLAFVFLAIPHLFLLGFLSANFQTTLAFSLFAKVLSTTCLLQLASTWWFWDVGRLLVGRLGAGYCWRRLRIAVFIQVIALASIVAIFLVLAVTGWTLQKWVVIWALASYLGAYLYSSRFVARHLYLAEESFGRDVKFSLLFFAVYFLPLGVWFLQPRVARLAAESTDGWTVDVTGNGVEEMAHRNGK